MKLIQPFEALIRNGVTLTFRLAAAGDQIQLDILPSGKDTKTGVALPPRALLGSAADLDEHLEAFVEKYAGSVTRIADVVANADQDLKQAEDAAAAQARKAVEEKRSNTKAPSKPGSKVATGTPKRRDFMAGMTGAGDEDVDDDDGAGAGDETGTTLNTGGGGDAAPGTSTPPADAGTAGAAQGGQEGASNALSPALF